MKASIIISTFFLLVIAVTPSFSQTTVLDDRNADENLSQKQFDFLNSEDIAKFGKIVLTVNEFEFENQIQIEIDGYQQVFSKDYLVNEREGMYVWYGREGFSDNHLSISKIDNRIIGSTILGNSNYVFKTIDDSYFWITYASSYYKKCGVSQETSGESSTSENPVASFNNIHETRSGEGTEGSEADLELNPCKVRIMACYTDDAVSAVPNIKDEIWQATQDMSYSFFLSGLPYGVELVHMEHIRNYQPVGNSFDNQNNVNGVIDLDRIINPTDGYLDYIHGLRDDHAADIVVLITNVGQNYIGWVNSISAPANKAFAWTAALHIGFPSLTFIHEIGHLMGCRHQINVDIKQTPYPYGHGFMDDPNGFTIMAVPGSSSAPHKLFWSGPTMSNGGIIYGNNQDANNQQVIINVWDRILDLSSPNQVFYLQDLHVNQQWQGTIYSDYLITTVNSVTIQWGRNYTFRAGDHITLNPGFRTAGAEHFKAYIEKCGYTDPDIPVDFKKSPLTSVNDPKYINPELTVSPTSFNQTVSIISQKVFNLDKVLIYTIDGKLLERIEYNNIRVKNHTINLGHLTTGWYILEVHTLTYKQNFKILKNE